MSGPMSREERIAAFLDGALDDAELIAFEAELERDPTLAAEVERMMENDTLLREAFAGPIKDGVDDALVARMGLAGKPQAEVVNLAEHRSGAPVSANDNPPFWRRWQVPLGGAIAAALALTVILNNQHGTGRGVTFNTALDATLSGQVATLDGGRELKPLLTFQTSDGRFCREFSIGKGDAGGTGIACRSDANWRVEALDKGATELAAGTGIALASGADATGLDAAYVRLNADDPMNAEREKALISNGWKQSVK
ncbi:MAG: hypothetical protein KDE61_05100 [Novosphingobium sp.]|nr:hypothetical protein [Novosphingobium sp.]